MEQNREKNHNIKIYFLWLLCCCCGAFLATTIKCSHPYELRTHEIDGRHRLFKYMVFRLTLAALNRCRATKESCNLFELTEYRLTSIPSVSLFKDRRKKETIDWNRKWRMENEIKGPHQNQTANKKCRRERRRKKKLEANTNFDAPTPHKHVMIIWVGYALRHTIYAYERVCNFRAHTISHFQIRHFAMWVYKNEALTHQ